MKNISTQYQDLLEGKMTKHQFLRNARMMFPSFVTNHNSFDDSVKILKTKGMLVEGDAVKGTPDKEPTYDSPTPDAKTKYKKVEQSPEVDEQDGVYPATTLTDIPKIKANKKVKDTSSGLEPIKDNDTKNEMKKVKVVKENVDIEIKKLIDTKKIDPAKVKAAAEKAMRGDSTELAFLMAFGDKAKPVSEDYNSYDDEPYYSDVPKSTPNKDWDSDDDIHDRYDKYDDIDENQRSFDDIFGDFIETDDSTEIKTYLKAKGKEAIAKIKAKLPQLKDAARTKLAKLMKVELDEVRLKAEAQTQMPADTLSVTKLFDRVPMLKQKLNLINNAAELQDIFDYILDRVNPSLGASDTQLRTALNLAIKTNLDNKKAEKQAGTSSSDSIKDKLKPAITKLVQEVLDEMGPQ